MIGSPLRTRRAWPGPEGMPPGPPPGPPVAPPPPDRHRTALTWVEVAVAVAGLAALCVLVLTKATSMLEPDDYAYQASIVGLSHGQLLLTTAQYHALSRLLGDGGQSIPQWVHLADGRWISQKNPGYPFLAVPFYLLGGSAGLRAAPLFYGALACGALFVGARRWLGQWGGSVAVLLFCTSGAALTFAWRPTMASFTDASLVAAGAGLLVWTMLAVEASARRRLVAGLGAFVALGLATVTRYTDVLELGVAVLAVVVFARRARLPWTTVAAWLGVVAAFGVLVLVFDSLVYGGPLETGYSAGLITFSLSAILPNVAHLPLDLVEVMPMAAAGVVAVGWIAWRALAPEWDPATAHPWSVAERYRDAAVGGALALGWAAIWGLYLAYTWTEGQRVGSDPVHVVRFYLPALGLIALLGAWALVRFPVAVWVGVVGALLGLGIASFHVMSAVGAAGPGPGGSGAGGLGSGGGGLGPGGGGLEPGGGGVRGPFPRGPAS